MPRLGLGIGLVTIHTTPILSMAIHPKESSYSPTVITHNEVLVTLLRVTQHTIL